MTDKYQYFGKYILLEKLATGGMAEVFLARSPSAGGIGRFVAIKRILPQYSDNPEFIQMFKEEAKIAINLSHSNIVSIYEFGIYKNQLFLVMDYVEGRNLRQILNKMKNSKTLFSQDQIVYMIKEVAAGLDHAHRSLNSATGKPLNITHRDMSPQNVMVSFEGEVKVVDFGIAKAETQLEQTRTGTLKGKFGYMSPEQAEGHDLDLRTDIFSTGTLLWELLSGERLFLASNELNTLRKIRDCQIPSLTKLNTNIHPELERITMKALARDRNLRYQTAAAFHRDLNRFINRQYPDFSSHDFSVFIKTLYTDEILDNRKRLVEYSNLPVKTSASRLLEESSDDATQVSSQEGTKTEVLSFTQAVAAPNAKSSTLTNTPPSEILDGQTQSEITATITETAAGESHPDFEADDLGSTKKLNAKQHLNLEALEKIDIGQIRPPEPPSGLINDDDTARLNTFTGSTDQPMQRMGFGRDDNRSATPQIEAHEVDLDSAVPAFGDNEYAHKRKKSAPQKQATGFSSFVILALFIVGTYFLGHTLFPTETTAITNFTVAKFNKIFRPNKALDGASLGGTGIDNDNTEIILDNPTQPIIEPDREPTNKEPIAPKTRRVVINSTPSGADIYIDGKYLGESTPAFVELPTDKTFTLALKKETYISYSRENITVDDLPKSVTATLQKAIVGYLDIDVRPPLYVDIYINGAKVEDKVLPLTKYAVPAKTPVVIRAINPFTGQKANASVTLDIDQRKSIILKLKKAKRLPSGKK